jgi:hypothetical protein
VKFSASKNRTESIDDSSTEESKLNK